MNRAVELLYLKHFIFRKLIKRNNKTDSDGLTVVDGNCFFCSVVKVQRLPPQLKHLPKILTLVCRNVKLLLI